MKYLPGILRLLVYWLKLLLVALVVGLLCWMAYHISMDLTGIQTIVKQGMETRAEAVIAGGDGDTINETMSRCFTWDFISKDEQLVDNPYRRFTVSRYEYRIKLRWALPMPWSNKTSVTVEEWMPLMKATLPEANYTEAELAAGDPVQPPTWPHGRYKLTCVRDDGTWKIDAIELIEELEEVVIVTPGPAPVPEG